MQRTVETIKDEIAAQRKSRDNRWEFRKDVYVNILTACDSLANSVVAIQTMQRTINSQAPGYESLLPLQQQNTRDMVQAQREFSTYALLAPLVLADDVEPLVQVARKELIGPELDSSDSDADLTKKTLTLLRLMAPPCQH